MARAVTVGRGLNYANALEFGAEVPKDKCVPVGPFRCSACGFLESYARPEFAAQ